LSFNKQF